MLFIQIWSEFQTHFIRPISRKLRPNNRTNMMLFIENGFEFQMYMYFLIPISIKLRPNYRKIWCFYSKWAWSLAALSQILWNKKLYYRQSMFFHTKWVWITNTFSRAISIKTLRPNYWKKMVFLIQNGSEFPKYFLRFI